MKRARLKPNPIYRDFWIGVCGAGHRSGYGWGIALGIVGKCQEPCRKWIDKLVRADASGIREVVRRPRKVRQR